MSGRRLVTIELVMNWCWWRGIHWGSPSWARMILSDPNTSARAARTLLLPVLQMMLIVDLLLLLLLLLKMVPVMLMLSSTTQTQNGVRRKIYVISSPHQTNIFTPSMIVAAAPTLLLRWLQLLVLLFSLP